MQPSDWEAYCAAHEPNVCSRCDRHCDNTALADVNGRLLCPECAAEHAADNPPACCECGATGLLLPLGNGEFACLPCDRVASGFQLELVV